MGGTGGFKDRGKLEAGGSGDMREAHMALRSEWGLAGRLGGVGT